MTRPAAGAAKRYRLGTHRVCAPEETWERIRGLLPRAGISRVADVTRLDRLGIPVYQAIRPASRNLSVSQGKAVTAAGARVSAAMEALELWHVENLDHLPQTRMSLLEMQSANVIQTAELAWRGDAVRLESLPLSWVRARSLAGGRDGWLPRQMIELDFTLPPALEPRMFHINSNGVASGNNLEEALLHGLCELLERHALAQVRDQRERRIALRPESFGEGAGGDLVGRIRDAGFRLAVWDVSGEHGVPVILAEVVGPDLPAVWRGSGCHAAPEIALTRALTEAVQTRLTYIAGARDDITPLARPGFDITPFEAFSEPAGERDLDELTDLSTPSVAQDLERVVERLRGQGRDTFYVDLSRDNLGVAVVKVFVPGLDVSFHA